MTERTACIAEKMIAYDCGDVNRIEHFIKVYGYASAIGRLERLNPQVQETLEIAALLHGYSCRSPQNCGVSSTPASCQT